MNQSATRRKPKFKGPTFQFGKYRGKSVKWVLENDPAYIVWAKGNVAKCYIPFTDADHDLAVRLVKAKDEVRGQLLRSVLNGP